MVNTCAALNTMYLHFSMHICKEGQCLVKVLYGQKGHHSIILSGIVKEDSLAIVYRATLCIYFHHTVVNQ